MTDRIADKASTLCWDCGNACGGCSWSRKYIPVNGWNAEPTAVRVTGGKTTPSYKVITCPEFKRDAEEGGKLRVGKPKLKATRRATDKYLKPQDVIAIRRLIADGYKVKDIAKTFDVKTGVIYSIRSGDTYKSVKEGDEYAT